jgi:transcription initiation factor TFIID subunit 11
MDNVSLASASVTGDGKKKKKPRKSKGKDTDNERARSATANEGKGKMRASRDRTPGLEESDEEVDGNDNTRVLAAKEDKQEDAKKRAMLTQHFNEEQFERFENWRQSKLADGTVRRVCYCALDA